MRNVYTLVGAGTENEETKTREDGDPPAGKDRERSIDDGWISMDTNDIGDDDAG